MDFNDITFRIRRILTSIGELYDSKIEDHYNHKSTIEGNANLITIGFDLVNDEFTAANKVFSVISNLAKLKDHFKKLFKQKGLDSRIVENTINSSEYLCWLIDIDNAEKHGYPLEHPPRSKDQPRISEIKTGITLSRNPLDHLNTKEISIPNGIKYTSNMIVGIFADIVDKDGKILCDLEDLIDNSLIEWENLYNSYISE